MKKIIEKITIISGTGTRSYKVGEDGVTSITDKGIEFESSIYFIYHVMCGENIKAEIINCPVEIEFKIVKEFEEGFNKFVKDENKGLTNDSCR